MRQLIVMSMLMILCATVGLAQEAPREYRPVEQILGHSGEYENHIFSMTIPRQWPLFTILGWQVPTEFGYTHEIDITKAANGRYVIVAELVLLQQEVSPVTDILVGQGMLVTAIHHHYLGDVPRSVFLHYTGTGTPTQLAQITKKVLDVLNTVERPNWMAEPVLTAPPATPPATNLPTGEMDRILGMQGKKTDAVYEYSRYRTDISIKLNTTRLSGPAGLEIRVDFLGTANDAAVVAEFALLPNEVAPVEQALRAHSRAVLITAVHNHMIGTSPEIIFMHLQGRGNATELARIVWLALEQTKLFARR